MREWFPHQNTAIRVRLSGPWKVAPIFPTPDLDQYVSPTFSKIHKISLSCQLANKGSLTSSSWDRKHTGRVALDFWKLSLPTLSAYRCIASTFCWSSIGHVFGSVYLLEDITLIIGVATGDCQWLSHIHFLDASPSCTQDAPSSFASVKTEFMSQNTINMGFAMAIFCTILDDRWPDKIGSRNDCHSVILPKTYH